MNPKEVYGRIKNEFTVSPYPYSRWKICYLAGRAVGFPIPVAGLLALFAMRQLDFTKKG